MSQVECVLVTPSVYDSAIHAALFELYIGLAKDRLDEPLYAATEAGFRYALGRDSTGVDFGVHVSLSGYA